MNPAPEFLHVSGHATCGVSPFGLPPGCYPAFVQREQNSRYASYNGLRFFADCAVKKWPLAQCEYSSLREG